MWIQLADERQEARLNFRNVLLLVAPHDPLVIEPIELRLIEDDRTGGEPCEVEVGDELGEGQISRPSCDHDSRAR